MKREWAIRTYKEGDEQGIYELWQTVYPSDQHNRDEWMKWWRWTYRDGPGGRGQIWIADHGGKIVGHYGVIFIPMKVGDEIVKASQNIDVMTDPEYRNQGIFATLEQKSLDEIGKQGIPFIIGFPNNVAYYGHKKSGWFDISNLKTIVKPFNWNKFVGLKIKNGFLSGFLATGSGLILDKFFFKIQEAFTAADRLTVTRISSFDERFDRLWSRVSSQYPIMVVRNKNYLNWRYSVPGKEYSIFSVEGNNEVDGYLVLGHRKRENAKTSFIFDMITESDKVMHCLISEAMKECKQVGSDFIEYRLIANKHHRSLLRKNGFIFIPFIKGSYFIAYSSLSQFTATMLKNPNNWFVQIGDSDIL